MERGNDVKDQEYVIQSIVVNHAKFLEELRNVKVYFQPKFMNTILCPM